VNLPLRPRYDVFLSYRHRLLESAWVPGFLAPRLRAAGLTVLLDIGLFGLFGGLTAVGGFVSFPMR
jgi:hypothetical protein